MNLEDRCNEEKVMRVSEETRRCFERKNHEGHCRFQMNRVEINQRNKEKK